MGEIQTMVSSSWHSYPKIYNVGHKYVADILKVPVNVEEKVDGSQFSFGVFDGEIRCKSKGCNLIVDAPEKMFVQAIETVKALAPILHDGWSYRGEYLGKPKHNCLAYERVPEKNIIIFDINDGEESYLSYEAKKVEASRIGLECVQLIHSGMVDSLEQFRALLETNSVLGGQKIEGVVIKPCDYNLFGMDKKVLMAKFVSEQFKEAHGHEWKKANPGQSDIVGLIGNRLKCEGRWLKSVQHLRESGKITDSPKDIGPLMLDIPEDIKAECIDEIKDQLFSWAWPQIRRIACSGVPEWYKELLVKKQFEVTNENQ